MPKLCCQLTLESAADGEPVVFADFLTDLQDGDDLSERVHAMVDELKRRIVRDWPPDHPERVIVGKRPLSLVR